MTHQRRVVIDSFADSVYRHLEAEALVAVDVLSATTTLITAAALGRRAFVAASAGAALSLAERLPGAILAGENEGVRPDGFELRDSPAALHLRGELDRPLILWSPPGTDLIAPASEAGATLYLCCFRNLTATVAALAERHDEVIVLGAGYHSEFSCEDQMATAWIADGLVRRGFEAQDLRTAEIVRRWRDADRMLISWGNSAEQLRRARREEDLEFVLAHRDDLSMVFRCENGEVVADVETPAAAEAWSLDERPRMAKTGTAL